MKTAGEVLGDHGPVEEGGGVSRTPNSNLAVALAMIAGQIHSLILTGRIRDVSGDPMTIPNAISEAALRLARMPDSQPTKEGEGK